MVFPLIEAEGSKAESETTDSKLFAAATTALFVEVAAAGAATTAQFVEDAAAAAMIPSCAALPALFTSEELTFSSDKDTLDDSVDGERSSAEVVAVAAVPGATPASDSSSMDGRSKSPGGAGGAEEGESIELSGSFENERGGGNGQ